MKCLAQDHLESNLLFVGTEFGVFVTVDGGAKWTQLKSGLPTIAVMDIDIQRPENDLVLATFGRGFYILDDYSPLRTVSSETFEREAHLFAIPDAPMYVETDQSESGDGFYRASNPPFGATVTYYLKEAYTSTKQKRREAEKEAAKKKTASVYFTLPGTLEFPVHDGHLLAVNQLPLEPYLAGVITAEMSGACPLEFLKSQVLVARSWVLVHTEDKHPDLPIHRCIIAP